MAKVKTQTMVKCWLHWRFPSAVGDGAHEFRQLKIICCTAKIEHSPIFFLGDMHQETHKWPTGHFHSLGHASRNT